jgi:hypothetical protein
MFRGYFMAIFVCSVLLFFGNIAVQATCTPCRGGTADNFTYRFQGFDLGPEEQCGTAVFDMEWFSTAADGFCDEQAPEFRVWKGCAWEIYPIIPNDPNKQICMWICGNPSDCEIGNHICEDCAFYTHSYARWRQRLKLCGWGKLTIWYDGNEVYNQAFDFTNGVKPGIAHAVRAQFLNRDFSIITTNDIHDAEEGIALELDIEWEDAPTPEFSATIKSEMSHDSLTASLPLTSMVERLAIYKKVLPAGFLCGLYGNPNEFFRTGQIDRITVTPGSYYCANPDSQPFAQTRITSIKFIVNTLSFENDYQIYEDSLRRDSTYAEIPITDPVWVHNGRKNKPAYYNKNSRPSIKLEIQANHHMYHNFDYSIVGWPDSSNNRYQTEIKDGMMRGHLDTISAITFKEGNFKDSVGIISNLKYYWMVRKSGLYGVQGFRSMDSTGAHTIYLSYSQPLLDTVNVLGLKYMCNYARNNRDALAIFESGSTGIFKEGWEYDPGFASVYTPPIDMVRRPKVTGQCACFANLLSYFGRSVGLDASTVTIINAKQCAPDSFELYIWNFSDRPAEIINLLSDSLPTTNNNIGMYWGFIYHAVSKLGDVLGDPVFGLVDKNTSWGTWWRYYYYPHPANGQLPGPCQNNEPPPISPFYYDHSPYITTGGAFPLGIYPIPTYCLHP